jgi:hypothetical protein
MIAPELYYPLMGGLYLFCYAALTVALIISILRQKNAGLLLLCLACLVSVPPTLGNLVISFLKARGYAAEYKPLIKNIYLMVTMLEPLAVFLMFAGIIVLAVRNFDISSRKTRGLL